MPINMMACRQKLRRFLQRASRYMAAVATSCGVCSLTAAAAAATAVHTPTTYRLNAMICKTNIK